LAEPRDLPSGLKPVDDFQLEFLPQVLAPYVGDIADRLQCPPDYVAVTTMVALGSVIGRRVGIRPQQRTDWTEYPNLWGMFIGPPGMLKSPAMTAGLKPLHRLEAEAAKKNKAAREAYKAELERYELEKAVAKSLIKQDMRAKLNPKKKNEKDEEEQGSLKIGEGPQEPMPVRYRTNDTSYEKLGELLVANPTGILIERDELVSLLKHLDREEQCVARSFYMSGWSGDQPYSFDRIGRGHIDLEAICISLLGNTQPARIAHYVRQANFGGMGGDGLIQRFCLAVWPNASHEWKDVDRYPNGEASEQVWKVFERASAMNPLKLGALKGNYDIVPYWRFSEAAGQKFLEWRMDFEHRLRSGSMSPALEGHLAKYRKLIPALALINHVADCQEGGEVGLRSLLRALAYSRYLESHACRLYSSGSENEQAAAATIRAHIAAGDLKEGFTARDIHQRGWSRLTDGADVQAGLDLLGDHFWIAAVPVRPSAAGGRPTIIYLINPKGLQT
jgi:hypothetical protein